ncbi:non-ribosomal peptide synthetase, partial [Fulvivirga kasyanovii]|uniref:non-ribosomal peptide synthetase n=1 Tax=Fulvivirga kasyanovii TaxID=396812 RepID=UPI0031E0D313
LSDIDRVSLLDSFNSTSLDYDREENLLDIFDTVSHENGGSIALSYGDQRMSYDELRKYSNQIAHYLHEKGVVKGDIVGLISDRSVEMVVWIFGILKCGAAYLPINTKLPEKRVRYQLEDSKARVLIGDMKYLGSYADLVEELSIKDSLYAEFPDDGLDISLELKDLMYIIYTSGSTGLPKGVMIEHGAVLNLIHSLNSIYSFDRGDVYLFKTPYYFDVSISELFGFFVSGAGSLAILGEEEEKDPYKIHAALNRYEVTHINFVPSLFHSFLDIVIEESGSLGSLKYIFLAGEALSGELVNKFRSLNSAVELENIYGPTEYTVYTSHYSLKGWKGGAVPIGKPLGNTSLYILDKENNLQPIGVAGELCISGLGLARGYLNNEELTRERFVPNPYVPGQLMYKTGDLARWTEVGNIEYLGRIDHQVKIRGNRVELGEIESVLSSYTGIKESLVISQEDGHSTKYLSAYYTSEVEVSVDLLRAHLATELPDYMIPSYFTRLATFPLTASGKKDIQALPSPSHEDSEEYRAPLTSIEKVMSVVWSSVLGRDGLSVKSNFFMIGGDSIKAIQIMSRLRREGYRVTMKDI